MVRGRELSGTGALREGGGPAGNRTRMLGLEDRCFVH